MTYTANDGTTFTDNDLIRWADEAEAGFPNSIVETASPRAWEVASEPMIPRTIRAPRNLWAAVDAQAAKAGCTASDTARQALARGLTS